MLLQAAVEHDHDRRHRRGERDLIGAHGRLGEVGQRPRRVVPLGVVADHRRGVLHAVVPLGAAPDRRVGVVAEDHVHRHAIAPRVVDRHRRMLQADRPVRHHRKRFALRLEVGVRHRHRRLFVAAGEELGTPVAAVVDERFVQPAEARARVRADVVEPERLEHVDHEVGAAALVFAQHLDVGRRRGFGRQRHRRPGFWRLATGGGGRGRKAPPTARGFGLRVGRGGRSDDRRAGERALLQEPAAFEPACVKASASRLLRRLRTGHCDDSRRSW